MTGIIKTKAVVLTKKNYSDSSLIVSLYTLEYGKISAIVKGARSNKSKLGKIIDPINIIEIILYNKPGRELQLITQADLILGVGKALENMNKVRYLFSAIELIDKIIHDTEKNEKLFNALVKFIEVQSTSNKNELMFLRFIYFIISEIGYQLPDLVCEACDSILKNEKDFYFNFNTGFVCDNCSKTNLTSFKFNKEQLNIFVCLRNRNYNNIDESQIKQMILFIEKYLSYHITEFNGLNSLKMF